MHTPKLLLLGCTGQIFFTLQLKDMSLPPRITIHCKKCWLFSADSSKSRKTLQHYNCWWPALSHRFSFDVILLTAEGRLPTVVQTANRVGCISSSSTLRPPFPAIIMLKCNKGIKQSLNNILTFEKL